MLIINFLENYFEPGKKISRRRKRQDNYTYQRENLMYNNNIFTVVDTNLHVENDNIKRLVQSFQGRVLPSNNDDFNDIYKPYLFDVSPYYKRAYVSSLIIYIREKIPGNACVCVEDYNFSFVREYLGLAQSCRKLVLFCNENKDAQVFKYFCMQRLGLSVHINDYSFASDCNLYINFSNVTTEKLQIRLYDEYKYIIPDFKYFKKNDFCDVLISKGAKDDAVCPAVEIIPKEKITQNSF